MYMNNLEKIYYEHNIINIYLKERETRVDINSKSLNLNYRFNMNTTYKSKSC